MCYVAFGMLYAHVLGTCAWVDCVGHGTWDIRGGTGDVGVGIWDIGGGMRDVSVGTMRSQLCFLRVTL